MTFVKGGEGWMYGERGHREHIKFSPVRLVDMFRNFQLTSQQLILNSNYIQMYYTLRDSLLHQIEYKDILKKMIYRSILSKELSNFSLLMGL